MATSKIKNINTPYIKGLTYIEGTDSNRTVTFELSHSSRRTYLLAVYNRMYIMFVTTKNAMNIYELSNGSTASIPTVTAVSGRDYAFTLNFNNTDVKSAHPYIIGENIPE